MSPDQAAWVREHVWTGAMRKTYREVPGFYLACACQSGLSHYCTHGACGKCHRAEPGPPSYEDLICDRTGSYPVHMAEPYEHPTQTITGPRRLRDAMVWHADRTCRWICPHTCHAAQPDHPIRYEQDTLFGLELAGSRQ